MMLDAVMRNFAHLHPSVYPLGDSHRRSDVSGSTTAIRCDFLTLIFERRLTDFTARLTSRNIEALDRALALAPRPSRSVRYEASSGLIQRRPEKREKSASHEFNSAPCSIARAARCASLTRLPAA